MKCVDVAVAIVYRLGSVLISQRLPHDTFANLWEFPGGKIEAGETPDDCIHREMREELGIVVECGLPLEIRCHTYPHVTVKLMPYLCELKSGDPRPHASQRVEWVRAERLKEYVFPDANAGLVDEVIRRVIKLVDSGKPEKPA